VPTTHGGYGLSPEVGEQLVGAYLKVIEGCDVITYNVRPPGGGQRGLEELDVIGLRFDDSTAFLCEVTTHLDGLLYKDNKTTIARIKAKHQRQRIYARRELKSFSNPRFQFWSPNVPIGYRTTHLKKVGRDLELVINGEYAKRVRRLQDEARGRKNDEGNDVFRLLQILEHLRGE
jgi:hypothetical protein